MRLCNLDLGRLRRVAVVLAWSGYCAMVQAVSIDTVGAAPIVAGDYAMARQLAYQQALSRAMAQQAQAAQGPEGGAPERFDRAEVLAETELEGSVQVALSVSFTGEAAGKPCAAAPLRKVAVAAFALAQPEQLAPDEFSAYAGGIAASLQQALSREHWVLAEQAGGEFLYRDPAHAPTQRVAPGGGGFSAVVLARRLRAQYVLAGVVRDFSIVPAKGLFGSPHRSITIDAYLHDGLAGHVVATHTVSSEVTGTVSLPPGMTFGSRAFAEQPLGATLNKMLAEIANWAGQQASCLPFAARVLRVEKERIYLDAGAEAHVAAGSTLIVFRPMVREGRARLSMPGGEGLGEERRPLRSLVLKDVYPQFSIAVIDPKDGRAIEVGDEVWAY